MHYIVAFLRVVTTMRYRQCHDGTPSNLHRRTALAGVHAISFLVQESKCIDAISYSINVFSPEDWGS